MMSQEKTGINWNTIFKFFFIIISKGVWTLEEDVHHGLVICTLTESSELPVSPVDPALSREIWLEVSSNFNYSDSKTVKWEEMISVTKWKLYEADLCLHLRF